MSVTPHLLALNILSAGGNEPLEIENCQFFFFFFNSLFSSNVNWFSILREGRMLAISKLNLSLLSNVVAYHSAL